MGLKFCILKFSKSFITQVWDGRGRKSRGISFNHIWVPVKLEPRAAKDKCFTNMFLYKTKEIQCLQLFARKSFCFPLFHLLLYDGRISRQICHRPFLFLTWFTYLTDAGSSLSVLLCLFCFDASFWYQMVLWCCDLFLCWKYLM